MKRDQQSGDIFGYQHEISITHMKRCAWHPVARYLITSECSEDYFILQGTYHI